MFNVPVLKIRRIGNSLGVIFPRKYVEEKHLHANDEVLVDVASKPNLRDVFGVIRDSLNSVDALNKFTNEGEDL